MGTRSAVLLVHYWELLSSWSRRSRSLPSWPPQPLLLLQLMLKLIHSTDWPMPTLLPLSTPYLSVRSSPRLVVGKSCHAEPECTTKSVVVGKALTGHEDPVCTEVEVPALGYGHIGKREADAEPFYGLPYGH